MTNKNKRLEPPLKLDMSFAEALSRFVAAKPEQVDESIERSKKKKPPQDGPLRRLARVKRELSAGNRNRKRPAD